MKAKNKNAADQHKDDPDLYHHSVLHYSQSSTAGIFQSGNTDYTLPRRNFYNVFCIMRDDRHYSWRYRCIVPSHWMRRYVCADVCDESCMEDR